MMKLIVVLRAAPLTMSFINTNKTKELNNMLLVYKTLVFWTLKESPQNIWSGVFMLLQLF